MVEIRKEIEMEDLVDVGKYLGCGHHVETSRAEGDTLTRYAFEMCDYFKSACDIFVDETGEVLKSGVSSLAPPEHTTAESVALVNSPGIYAQSAASFLMKLLSETMLPLVGGLHTTIGLLCDQVECRV